MFIVPLAALCACSPEAAKHSSETTASAPPALPDAPFRLACESATEDPTSPAEIPDFARNDFDVEISAVNGTFALPGQEDEPIYRMAPEELVLRDERIELGADNNLERHLISYDLKSRRLTYSSSWSGIVPVFEYFHTTCSIET